MWRRVVCYLLVLAEIFFDPEDGGDMILRNVGCISTGYTASHPRRWYSSLRCLIHEVRKKRLIKTFLVYWLAHAWSLLNWLLWPSKQLWPGEGLTQFFIQNLYICLYYQPIFMCVLKWKQSTLLNERSWSFAWRANLQHGLPAVLYHSSECLLLAPTTFVIAYMFNDVFPFSCAFASLNWPS
jgi:hypothetical protein